MPLERHRFIRSHALGNDYLVIDGDRFGIPIDAMTVRRICDRHVGVGSDGILMVVPPPPGHDAAVRIFNPDGSEAEKSGNGVRIFAKFCIDHGYVSGGEQRPLRIWTLGGTVVARFLARNEHRTVLQISMGHASFRCADLPMAMAMAMSGAAEWIERDLQVGDRSFCVTAVSMGNPHVVVFDPEIDEARARHYGPLIENHRAFPRRTNVQFVRVQDRAEVHALIWERGAGWTCSSGSSACAVAAACVRGGRTSRAVQVVMPGGTLDVQVHEDFAIDQTGPAQEIASGTLSRELIDELCA